MVVWRSERLSIEISRLRSVGENENKVSECKWNSSVQLSAQFLLFEEMSITENRFILTLYSPTRLANHLSTQN